MATPNPPKPPKTCPKRSKTVQQLLEHCMTVTVTGFDIRPSLQDLGPLRSYLLRRRHCRELERRSPARQRGSEWIRVPGKCSRDPRPSTQSTVAAAFLQPPRFSRPLQSWRASGRLALSWRAPPRVRPRRPIRSPGRPSAAPGVEGPMALARYTMGRISVILGGLDGPGGNRTPPREVGGLSRGTNTP